MTLKVAVMFRGHSSLNFDLLYEESATSYGARLAHYMKHETPYDLCSDFGLRWQDIVSGDEEALAQLARHGGANPADLRRWSIRKNPDHSAIIGHDLVPHKALRRLRLHLCPHCAVLGYQKHGILGVYRRYYWNLVAINTCPEHHAPLFAVPRLEHSFGNYDVPKRVLEHWDKIEAAASHAHTRRFSDFEAYMLHRLRHGPAAIDDSQHQPMDALPLAFGYQLCRALGLGIMQYEDAARDIRLIDEYDACLTGFEYARNGYTGIRCALETMQKDPLKSNACHKLDFGAFHQWLGRSDNSEHMRQLQDVVREFIFSHYPIEQGTVILGKPCPETLIYSVHSAKRQHGISRKRLTRNLIAMGIALPIQGQQESVHLRRQITKEDIETILGNGDDLLNRDSAIVRLGSTDSVFRRLRQLNLITSGANIHDQRTRYSRKEIDALVESILTAVQQASHGTVHDPVAWTHAAFKLGANTGDVLDILRRGELAHAEVRPQNDELRGLDRIFVNTSALRDALIARMIPTRTKTQTAKLLATSLRMVGHLHKIGFLEMTHRGVPLRGHDRPAVTIQSIERFLKAYTTVGRIARHTNHSTVYMMHYLERIGVDHMPVPQNTGRFYKRDDLKDRAFFLEFHYPT